ncbi:MAG: hypothetical protein KJ600_01985 [Nanoarchaeota archaeon]|nr:hypothetical protein [Nanoarchaeota archaeon]MBU1103306.1 hypothetical protein [Nanoarchaeota archaeon]
MIKRLFFVLIFVLFASNAAGLGAFPGRATIDFVPGLEKTVTFTIVNSDQKDVTVVVSAQGELEEYISISENVIKMKADEPSKEISYTLKLPQTLTPGLHTADVVVVQLPEQFVDTGQMSVGAAVAVLTQVYLDVPYPGKYAEANMNVLGEPDGSMRFVISLDSKGEFDIVRAAGSIDIFTSLNEKIASVKTNEIGLSAGRRGELVATWDSRSMPSGLYRAVAEVVYDEETMTIEKEFGVGRQRLSLEGIEVNDFSLGEIAKFEVLVKNEWSEKITGAFIEMMVYSEAGNVLADFKSANYDIEPLEQELMVAFWDTEGVKEGNYDSILYLRYLDASDKIDLSLGVLKNSIEIVGFGYVISKQALEGKNLTYILIGVIGFLVVANLSWFLLLRKRMRK